jgi:hypothetical protein
MKVRSLVFVCIVLAMFGLMVVPVSATNPSQPVTVTGSVQEYISLVISNTAPQLTSVKYLATSTNPAETGGATISPAASAGTLIGNSVATASAPIAVSSNLNKGFTITVADSTGRIASSPSTIGQMESYEGTTPTGNDNGYDPSLVLTTPIEVDGAATTSTGTGGASITGYSIGGATSTPITTSTTSTGAATLYSTSGSINPVTLGNNLVQNVLFTDPTSGSNPYQIALTYTFVPN